MDEILKQTSATPVAVLSGNRNFPGRVHHRVGNSFLASPPLIVAYALAGDFAIDISKEPLGMSPEGERVYLRDIWPDPDEIDRILQNAVVPNDFRAAFDEAENSPDWKRLEAPDSCIYPWDDNSTYLRRPPFVSFSARSRLGRYVAHPLLVLGDDVTTDHISPAGAIASNGDAAEHLVNSGENAADLGVYSARRGNWEVMIRGIFSNPGMRNLLAPDLEAGQTVFAPSGEVLPVWRAAERYGEVLEPVVIVAGERYGMGSSRDWAAKGTYLLGVRAVFAVSFERIHRSNLINMGILPLVLSKADRPTVLGLGPGDRIEVDAAAEVLKPSGATNCCISYGAGKRRHFEVSVAVETESELETLVHGGLIPKTLRELRSQA
jgi:aconitate hydratase